MKSEAFTIECLIRMVAKYTGERFATVGEGKDMIIHLEDQDAYRTFAPKGRKQIVCYLQGMIRASRAIAARGK